WDELINKDDPKAPSIHKLMDIDGNLLSPSAFNRLDSNAIYLFNLAVYSQYALLSISRDDIDEVVRAKDRLVLSYLDIDRFDHETNVDDVDAWSLKDVVMPSGGQLSFTYESDDYSFVGRAKMADQLEIFSESLQDAVENKLDEKGYYKRFNMEKDLLSKNNLFRIRGWSKELSNIEKILKQGNRDTNSVEFRVSSLFRIYRNISDDPETPNYQLNEEFVKLKEWQEDSLMDDEHKLHLIAMFDPTQFSVGGIMLSTSLECGMEVGQRLVDVNRPIVPIPVDLGPVKTDDDAGFVFPTIEQMNTNPEIAAKYACQRGYVDFEFEKLRKGKFFQFRIIQDNTWDGYCGSCVMQNGSVLGNKLQVPEKGTCHDDYVVTPPFFFEMMWGRKVDFTDPDDFVLDDKVGGEYYKTYEYAGKQFYDLCRDGDAYNCYKFSLDGGPNTHKGYFAWNYMQEFSIQNTDTKQDDPGAFSKGYWDYYSTDMFIKNEDAEMVSNGAGIPGGGLRVKKLVYNTGWSQEKAAPSNARVVEYSYVCEASDGTKGSMSSGATPSLPPPFSNKGDDRPDLPPQVSFLRGGPSIKYGTVHEERKGRGRIVRNFLTCADVGDYMADDTLNYWIFDEKIGDVRKVNGAYDVDEYEAQWPGSQHHRYRLNRCSHFQGLPVNVKKYSEDNKLVESTSYRYLTSLTNTDICNIDLLSKLNGVNGRASSVFISQDDLKLFAGNENYKLLRHPLSRYVGTTTERFRMKWIEKLPKSVFNSAEPIDEDDFDDFFDAEFGGPKRSLHDLVGIIEMEVLEHSIRQYSSTDLQYAGKNPKFGNGIGTRTVQSYFDFLTGSPLVTTVMEANSEQQYSCGCCDAVSDTGSDEDDQDVITPLTKVTIPQYWVSTDFKDKNMLTQTYSISQYEGLGPLECSSDDCDADEVAQQWHDKLKPASDQQHVLLSRSLTNWYGADAVDTNRYKKMSEMQLRADLRVDPVTGQKSLNLSDALLDKIGYPYDPVSNPDLFTTDKVYSRYDVYGHVLEERDANNTPVANFYTLNDYGTSKAAVVLNASRNASAIMNVDEVAGENGDVPFNWPESFGGSGTINTEHSRSGRKSLNLGANAVTVNTIQHDTGMSFMLSFWVRNPQNLTVNGTPLTDGRHWLVYDSAGSEWQKMWTDVGPSSASITISGSAGQIDDIRLFPKDAHVYSMTYDSRGKMTSFDDQNDNIWYYMYDAFGNMTEVRDRQKMIVSTQSRVEAKR
ncbi:MAG TPA: RHS repeat domain-containing protein, partial [Chitinispirillaceae bacterium]|nr:RHS repeat domain-containing protein [Chitinispirillaceae bacterium]